MRFICAHVNIDGRIDPSKHVQRIIITATIQRIFVQLYIVIVLRANARVTTRPGAFVRQKRGKIALKSLKTRVQRRVEPVSEKDRVW